MDLASTAAILASLAVILTFVWNIFFGRRTLSQLFNGRRILARSGGTHRIRQNLPRPIHKIFWGREKELKTIIELLQPYPRSRYHIVVIQGIAGIGKTALALEVAHRIQDPQFSGQTKIKFDAIVWASAKPDILTPEGIELRSDYIRLIDDVYAAIALTLEEPQILQAKREHQPELVRAMLAKHRVLLLLDNIEVLSDEKIISFIRDIPDPTKVILTTRHRVDGAFPIVLHGLDLQSSLALMSKEAQIEGSMDIPEQVRLSIYEKTGGVPLAMVWTIGRLRLGYDPEVVLKDLASHSSDISRFCFEQSMAEIRGTRAWDVLYAISIFRKGANKEALSFLCNLDSQLHLNDHLVLLMKLSLISQSSGLFTMLLLTRTYMQEIVQKETPELREHLKNRFVDHYASQVRTNVGSDYWDGRIALNTWARFGKIVDEIFEVREAIHIAYDEKRWPEVRDLVFGIVHILWVLDRWEERIELTNMALQAVQQLGQPQDEAWLRIDALGFIFLAQGDYDNARRTIETGLKLAEASGNKDAIVVGLCFMARIMAHFGNDDEAQSLLRKARDLPANQWLKTRIETTGNLIERRLTRKDGVGKEVPRSRIELEQQREHLNEILTQVRRLRRNGNSAKARNMLVNAERIENDIGDLELRARIRLELGLLEFDSGNFNRGEEILKDVREVFTYLGRAREVDAIKKRLMEEANRQKN